MQRVLTIGCLTAALVFVIGAGSAHAVEPDYSKDPVLMVHGYFLGQVGSWSWMKARLKAEGWPPEYLYSFTFENVFGCNPKHGEEIEANVKKVLAETGRDKLDILCHSMGCVDVRWYIKNMCGYKYINDYVSIAGAHKGSTMACAEPLSCGAKQMCVAPYGDAWMQNEFLYELNKCDITPWHEILYTSIWTQYDEIIVPSTNCIIEGAVNVMVDALVEHGLILANEETAKYVIPGLDGAGTNNNVPTSQPPCVTLCEDPLEPGAEIVEPFAVAEILPEYHEAADLAGELFAAEIVTHEDLSPGVDATTKPTPDAPTAAEITGDGGPSSPPADNGLDPAINAPQHIIKADPDGCNAGSGHAGPGTVFGPAMLLLCLMWLRRLSAKS